MEIKTTLTTAELSQARRIISEKTGYTIQSDLLLLQIFRRSSLAKEQGEKSNEVLEFIGDQVLGYYIVKLVAARCGSMDSLAGYSFRFDEGEFTRIKQKLASNDTISDIIDDWGLVEYLLFSKGDIKIEADKQPKAHADLFEAILGAIAIESNWDPAALETAVARMLDIDNRLHTLLESGRKVKPFDLSTAITTLKEWAEQGRCTKPVYRFYGPEALGYHADGTPVWACSCQTISDKTAFMKTAKAASKKEAKKAATYILLCDLWDVRNHDALNDYCHSWIFKDGEFYPDRPPFRAKKFR